MAKFNSAWLISKRQFRSPTKDGRNYSHDFGRVRVRVEHSTEHLKSFRILSERYRYRKARYAVKISTLMALANWEKRFKNTSPFPPVLLT